MYCLYLSRKHQAKEISDFLTQAQFQILKQFDKKNLKSDSTLTLITVEFPCHRIPFTVCLLFQKSALVFMHIFFVPFDVNAKGMADWCHESPPRQRSCYVFQARRTVRNYVLHKFKWNSVLGLLCKAVLPLYDRHNTASIWSSYQYNTENSTSTDQQKLRCLGIANVRSR
jgi:hypothetical protein